MILPGSKYYSMCSFHAAVQGMTYKEELQGVYSLLLSVDRVLATYSPVVIMQRWIRGWLVRKALAKSTNPTVR